MKLLVKILKANDIRLNFSLDEVTNDFPRFKFRNRKKIKAWPAVHITPELISKAQAQNH